MNFYEQVYAVVRCVPRGKVTSYGRVARMLGRPRAARAVGYAMNALKDKHKMPDFSPVPWQRVINSQGRISIINREYTGNEQADLLRAEGVPIDESLKLPSETYWWEGLNIADIDDIMSGRIP